MINKILTFEQLIDKCKMESKLIWQICIENEMSISELTCEQIRFKVLNNLNAMKEAIKEGLKSKELSISGQCGDDCFRLQNYFKFNKALFGDLFEKITTYALAIIEQNLRMGAIVACPTAGSCAIVPSVLVAVSQYYKLKEEDQINALITAGMIGQIISYKVAPAGAVAGCQAECGLASAMAAAALTQIRGGSVLQIIHSSILAIKNILGLVCDPVCGLVEIPCVKRNPFLAIHSVTASELALSGIESKISPDDVVDAMKQIGQLMSPLLKESSQAGLAKTFSAEKIAKVLKSRLE